MAPEETAEERLLPEELLERTCEEELPERTCEEELLLLERTCALELAAREALELTEEEERELLPVVEREELVLELLLWAAMSGATSIETASIREAAKVKNLLIASVF